jgi:TPR repeat protein
MANPRKQTPLILPIKRFNKAVALYNIIQSKAKHKSMQRKLRDDLLSLVTGNLLPGMAEPVCVMLMKTVVFLEEYPVIKASIEKILQRKDLTQESTARAYSDAAFYAVVYKDKDISMKKIEIFYNLSLHFKYTKTMVEVHAALSKFNFVNNKFAEAFKHFEKMTSHKSNSNKIIGYYYGAICLMEMNNLTLAQAFAEKCVSIFESDNSFAEMHQLEFSNAAQNAAKLFDHYENAPVSDPVKAIRYYELGIKLGCKFSMHDMACKYDKGEDVEQNIDKAIELYRAAAKFGHSGSLMNLFLTLRENNRDFSSELEMLKQIIDDCAIYATISWHHTLEYQKDAKRNAELNIILPSGTYNENAKIAFQYAQLSLVNNDPDSLFHMGVMHHLGIGTEVNLDLAEIYYLKVKDAGYPIANNNLAALYQDRLKRFKDDRQTILKMVQLVKTTLVKQDEKDFDTIRLELLSMDLKIEFQQQSKEIKTVIQETARDIELKIQKRILEILDMDCYTLDNRNLTLLINRLGFLTGKSLTDRKFHNQQLPRLFEFINAAEKKLDLKLFEYSDIVSLIDGVSKLHLQTHVMGLGNFIKKLYQEALRLSSKLHVSDLTSLIYSATRLDHQDNILDEILPPLVQKILDMKDDISLYDYAKCFYAAAILCNSNSHLISTEMIKMLLEKSIYIFNNSENYNIRRQANDPELIFLRQLYMASYYFSKKFPELVSAEQTASLKEWNTQLSNLTPKVTVSELQDEVTGFITDYFPECAPEEIINILPVDCFVWTSDINGFILEVDGPTHFLHDGSNEPKQTQKVQFRNAYLSYTHPVICISYFDWESRDAEQRIQLLTDLLQSIDIKIGEKWTKARSSHSKSFFKSAESKTSTIPRTTASPATPSTPRTGR